MRLLNFIKAKSSLLFISGILMVIVVFIFISCGKGPQTKVLICDRGNFAVDFSKTPADKVGAIFAESDNAPKIGGKEFTIEAWVKNKTSDLNGDIFRHFSATGTALRVDHGKPKFSIYRLTFPPGECPTTTDYTVDSGDFSFPTSTPIKEEWHHIAGVLTTVIPPTPHPTSSCTEPSHLEIYIDGNLKNCATTLGKPNDPATSPAFGVDASRPVEKEGEECPIGYEFFKTVQIGRFNKAEGGIIDEVRIWVSEPGEGGARTETEIDKCKGTELSFSPQNPLCKIELNVLKSYWRLNEGQGTTACDASGNGLAGVVQATPPEEGLFPDGWVAGDWP